MSAVLLGTYAHASPQWHAAREGRLGGSEIAAVVGLSSWESRFSLWWRKRGVLPPLDLTDEMDAGLRLEPAIGQWFFDQHPWWAHTRGGTYRHAERPWQSANPDVVLNADQWQALGQTPDGEPLDRATGVELKFSLYGDDFGDPGTDEVPIHYRCQCLWYCDVLGWPGMWLVVFIGSRGEFRQYWVPGDEDEQEWLRANGDVFMADLESGVEPDLDAHTATYRAVRQLHPDIDPDARVDLPGDLVLDWHVKAAMKRTAEREEREANARVLQAMGAARRGYYAGRPAVIRVPSQGDAPPHLRTSRPRKRAS